MVGKTALTKHIAQLEAEAKVHNMAHGNLQAAHDMRQANEKKLEEQVKNLQNIQKSREDRIKELEFMDKNLSETVTKLLSRNLWQRLIRKFE
jgi:hypothetical protein